MITHIVIADGAKFLIRQILAHRTGVDCLLSFQNGIRKFLCPFLRKAQNMERQTLGSLAADTGKPGKLVR